MKTTLKNIIRGMLALLAMAVTGQLAAQENAYDVLGKALRPIANVFTPPEEPGNHALVLDAHLLEASKLPPELQGQALHVALMTPDAVLVQAPIAGELLTVCRDGDLLWATPGSKIQFLLDQVTTDAPEKKKKHKDKEAKLMGPLELPVPQKDLVFLPILFQVADAGSETVAGAPCRVLDVQLMPQIAKSLHAEDWTARVWVGADYGIVRIALTGPDWSGKVAIDKLVFSPDLPEAMLQSQGTDVLRLTAEQFVELLRRVGRK
jgi:hypothetical protein